MPRKAKHRVGSSITTAPGETSRGNRRRRGQTIAAASTRASRTDATNETTVIVLRIAAPRANEFEAMFATEEIPIWDDFTRRGRFLEASLVRAAGGSETREGLQDYILHVVAADHEAHEEHDRDPRFNSFLTKAQKLQPEGPLVWFGKAIFERRA